MKLYLNIPLRRAAVLVDVKMLTVLLIAYMSQDVSHRTFAGTAAFVPLRASPNGRQARKVASQVSGKELEPKARRGSSGHAPALTDS